MTVKGQVYGLVPSDGTAYVFGTGSRLHHDRHCLEGSDTPAERVRTYADPDGELWLTVLEPAGDPARAAQVVNVAGHRVAAVCSGCALRPSD